MYYRAKTWKLPQKFNIIVSKSKIRSEIYYRKNKWEKYSLILKIFVPQIYCLVLTKTLKLLQFLKIRRKNYEYKITMWYWSIKIQHYLKIYDYYRPKKPKLLYNIVKKLRIKSNIHNVFNQNKSKFLEICTILWGELGWTQASWQPVFFTKKPLVVKLLAWYCIAN